MFRAVAFICAGRPRDLHSSSLRRLTTVMYQNYNFTIDLQAFYRMIQSTGWWSKTTIFSAFSHRMFENFR